MRDKGKKRERETEETDFCRTGILKMQLKRPVPQRVEINSPEKATAFRC